MTQLLMYYFTHKNIYLMKETEFVVEFVFAVLCRAGRRTCKNAKPNVFFRYFSYYENHVYWYF